jgi:ABC-type dipeptide/oligopeptide/nickel transport system permease subunit
MAFAEAAARPYEYVLPPRKRWTTLRAIARKKVAMIAITYLCFFYAVGVFAPVLAPHDPYQQNITLEGRQQGPSSEHWLGTDNLGRDLTSRAMYAARTTILFTIAVIITGGLFLGLGLGLLAGYRGGWVDTAIMRIGEVLSGLPTLLIILAISAAFRLRIDNAAFWLREHTFLGDDAKTLVQFTIIVAATVPFAWIGTSRIVRSQALYLREADYVTSAELAGGSTWWIITRHILPGVIPLYVVGLSAGMAGIAGTEVALSFLGLGISPPAASFGNMIADGAGVRTFSVHPHLLLSSAVPVILFFYAWNLLGDALVDILEHRAQPR